MFTEAAIFIPIALGCDIFRKCKGHKDEQSGWSRLDFIHVVRFRDCILMALGIVRKSHPADLAKTASATCDFNIQMNIHLTIVYGFL